MDVEAIINKYSPLVHGLASKLSAPGVEREDLFQEGLIGLYGAILAFDKEKEVDFTYFARLCVERRLHSVIKAALRQKHAPLTGYEPLLPNIRDTKDTPEDALLGLEGVARLEAAINTHLSEFERKALSQKLQGYSNAEIAEKLGCSKKSVENAMRRARKKLLDNLENF
ncbi:MAG: sigma-70 family RNA polymerase sigma factor [Defluviitaleaceae bacterium]|nr:sigma-70 family RNA polymerase sigma factor [Defluviitaleaceae bacterium]